MMRGKPLAVAVALLAAACTTSTPPDDTATNAPPSEPRTERYVALGDSYTSAPGTGRPVGTPPGCARSHNNYPRLVADELGIAEFTDASCSGATTRDLTTAQRTSDGTNPPQLDAVGPGTTLVTLGIGGNDVGFVQLAARCAGSGSAATPCVSGEDLAEAIEDTADRVGTVLREIRERAPNARVVVVGYPTVLPPDPATCRPELPYAPAELTALRESLLRLNEVLAEQAAEHDATYADTASGSRGHGICAGPGSRWIEGLRSETGAAPLHPTARGERAMAEAVLAAVR